MGCFKTARNLELYTHLELQLDFCVVTHPDARALRSHLRGLTWRSFRPQISVFSLTSRNRFPLFFFFGRDVYSVGILSLENRLGLGAGICIGNILDTEWGQNMYSIYIALKMSLEKTIETYNKK
jgi:hypothetical protein